jgi:hypothetical protein
MEQSWGKPSSVRFKTPGSESNPSGWCGPVHQLDWPALAGYPHWAPKGDALQYVLTKNGVSNLWEQKLTGGPPEADHELSIGPDLRLFLVVGRQTAGPYPRKQQQGCNPDQ